MTAASLASTLAVAASLGIASALHCVGMCGGFSLLVAGRERGAARTLGALARFHAGRVATYVFLGAAAGAVGTRLIELGASRRWIALAGGAALVAIALGRFGVLRAPRLGAAGRALAELAGAMRRLAARRDGVSLLLFGAANGFLPCAATAGGIALALASGGALGGAAVMAVFGLATAPALIAFGWGGARVSGLGTRRAMLARAGAAVTLLAGLVTLWRAGLGPIDSCCAAVP